MKEAFEFTIRGVTKAKAFKRENLNLNFIKEKLNIQINLGAKIYAAILIAYNVMGFVSYYNIMKNPSVLQQAAQNMNLTMTDEQVQQIVGGIPIQLALAAVVIFGLLMLVLNQPWGIIPFAAVMVINSITAFISKDIMSGLSALLPVALMILIIWVVGPRRLNRQKPGRA